MKKFLLVAFSFALLFTVTACGGSKEENKEDKKDDPVATTMESYNGVYTKDGLSIKIYGFNKSNDGKYTKDTLEYSIETDDMSSQGYFEIANKKGKSIIFDSELEVEIKDDGLYFKGNDKFKEDFPKFSEGLFKKTKEYTAKDYFNDNIGETNYINSKYNGLFSNNGIKLYMYQIEENSVEILVVGKTDSSIQYFQKSYTIKEDGTLAAEELFDDEGNLIEDSSKAQVEATAKLDGESVVFTSKEYTDINGTYKKEKALTVEEIIKVVY